MQHQQSVLKDRIAAQQARVVDLNEDPEPDTPIVGDALVSAQGNHSFINTMAHHPAEESKRPRTGPNLIQNADEVE